MEGQRPLQLCQRRPAGRELGRDPEAEPELPRQPHQEDLRPEPVGGRRADPEQDVDQRHHPQVGGQQAGERQERQRLTGPRRQRPEELLGQARCPGHHQQQAVGVVPLERQNPRSPARQQRPDPGHRVGGADQPGADHAGQVHGHQGQPGVRVELQRDGWPDQLHLPARHRRRCDPQDRHRHDPGLLRLYPRRAPAQLADPVRQRGHVRQERHGRRAPDQGRHAVGPPLLRVGLLREGRPLDRLQQRRADLGAPVQLARVLEERGDRHRLLHPGLVVDEPADAEHRRPLRQVRRHVARPVEPGWCLCRRPHRDGDRSHQPEHRGVARRRVVRRHRQRPDGGQGELQPLWPAGRHRPRDQRQPTDRRLARLRVDRPERRRQGAGR